MFEAATPALTRYNVVVQLDGEAYREYTIDFATGSVTNTVNHEYNYPTTAPIVPSTQPPTQPDIIHTEPPTTEPVTDDFNIFG